MVLGEAEDLISELNTLADIATKKLTALDNRLKFLAPGVTVTVSIAPDSVLKFTKSHGEWRLSINDKYYQSCSRLERIAAANCIEAFEMALANTLREIVKGIKEESKS